MDGAINGRLLNLFDEETQHRWLLIGKAWVDGPSNRDVGRDTSFPHDLDVAINAELGAIEKKVKERSRSMSSSSLAEHDASALESSVQGVEMDEEGIERWATIYAFFVLGRRISIQRSARLMCRAMLVVYSLPGSQEGSFSTLFPSRSIVILFVKKLMDMLQLVVKSFGSDFILEVIRFADAYVECSQWRLIEELRSNTEPWDCGGGDSLPHYGSVGINSVEQLEDTTFSSEGSKVRSEWL